MIVQAMPFPSGQYGLGSVGSAAHVAGSGAQTLSLPYPATIKAGQILFAHVAWRSSLSGGPPTTPAGWSVAKSGQMNASSISANIIYWKRATGSESGNLSISTTSNGTSGELLGRMAAFGGLISSGTPFETPVNHEGSSASADSAAITPPAADMVVANFIAAALPVTMTPPSGYTEAYDDNDSSGVAVAIGLNHKKQTGAIAAQTTTLSSSAAYGVVTLALRKDFTPSFSVDPSISSANGFYATGDILTGSPGTHTGGSEAYQWTRDGTAITGETGTTYTIQAADDGSEIAFTVTAYAYTGNLGASATAGSAPVTGTGDPVYETQTRTLSDSSNRTLSDSSDRTMSNRTA